jgi:cell division transport system permease protein
MSFWVTSKRVARYGLAGFVRNGFVSLAAVLIMTITLFVVAGLMIAGAALSSTLKQVTQTVDVTVYFLPAATAAQVNDIQQSLQALPEVAHVTYESPDQALAQFKEIHKDDQLQLQALDLVDGNPFGPALEVSAKEISQYESIANYLTTQQQSGSGSGSGSVIDKVNFYQNKTAIDRLTNIIDTSRRLGLVVAIILGLASLLISFNTIRLAIYTSRDEIGVMNLVGAGHWYVRGPFMIAGVLYGVVSGITVLLLLYPITLWLGPGSERFLVTFNVFRYYTNTFPIIFLIVMGSGIALGALSSYLAVRRYLRA